MEELKKVPLGDWLKIAALIGIMLAVGAWKQATEDHLLREQDDIQRQAQRVNRLNTNIRTLNDKLDALKDSINAVDKRMISVEEWMELDAVNQKNYVLNHRR